MMENNWSNFLKNLGEWRGSFTSVGLDGELQSSTPSILNLEGFEDNQLVKFRLRRFGSEDYNDSPVSDLNQEYRQIGQQNIFFETGAFSKGSLQVAPFAEFGAEYGFVGEDRRLRFVQLYDKQGNLRDLILIREFRSNTDAKEQPPLEISRLLGNWQGTACTVYADWTPTETSPTYLEIKEVSSGLVEQRQQLKEIQTCSQGKIEDKKILFTEDNPPRQILLLPDGTSSNTPLQVSHRQEFYVEVGWLLADNKRQRLIRNYDQTGKWISATHIIEQKIE